MKHDYGPGGEWGAFVRMWVAMFILGIVLGGCNMLVGVNTLGWASTLKMVALWSGVIAAVGVLCVRYVFPED